MTQQPPASVTAGSGFGLTVQAEDSSGNLITSFNGTVTVALASNPGGAHARRHADRDRVGRRGHLLRTDAHQGRVRLYALHVTGSGFGWGVTDAITVTPAAATQLVITQQPPSTVKVSTPFAMKASIEDPYGNVVTTASGT